MNRTLLRYMDFPREGDNDSGGGASIPGQSASPTPEPAPAPSPEPTPESEPDDGGADDSGGLFDFSGLGDDVPEPVEIPTSSDGPVAAPKVEDGQSAQPATPAEPPAEPTPAAAASAEPAAQPPAAEPGAQQEQVESQPVSAEGLADLFKEKGAELASALATQNFALSEDEITELETDAVAAVPKLLARAQIKAVEASLRYMQQLVPQMVAQQLQQTQAATSEEQAFFTQFAQLNKAEHGEMIRQVSHALYQSNPKMSRKQLYDLTGAIVMQQAGIVPPQQQAQPTPAPAPARQNGAAPFTPAVAATRVAPPQQPVPDPWGGLGQDFD